MDKLKYIKLENEDGSYSDSIPLAVDANHVDVNGNTLTNVLNNKANSSTVENLATEVSNKADTATLNSSVNTLVAEINTQKGRIDNLATLEEGSTTGDAELIDARTSYDGFTYDNLGEAVRSQIENVTGIYNEDTSDKMVKLSKAMKSPWYYYLNNDDTVFSKVTASVGNRNFLTFDAAHFAKPEGWNGVWRNDRITINDDGWTIGAGNTFGTGGVAGCNLYLPKGDYSCALTISSANAASTGNERKVQVVISRFGNLSGNAHSSTRTIAAGTSSIDVTFDFTLSEATGVSLRPCPHSDTTDILTISNPIITVKGEDITYIRPITVNSEVNVSSSSITEYTFQGNLLPELLLPVTNNTNYYAWTNAKHSIIKWNSYEAVLNNQEPIYDMKDLDWFYIGDSLLPTWNGGFEVSFPKKLLMRGYDYNVSSRTLNWTEEIDYIGSSYLTIDSEDENKAVLTLTRYSAFVYNKKDGHLHVRLTGYNTNYFEEGDVLLFVTDYWKIVNGLLYPFLLQSEINILQNQSNEQYLVYMGSNGNFTLRNGTNGGILLDFTSNLCLLPGYSDYGETDAATNAIKWINTQDTLGNYLIDYTSGDRATLSLPYRCKLIYRPSARKLYVLNSGQKLQSNDIYLIAATWGYATGPLMDWKISRDILSISAQLTATTVRKQGFNSSFHANDVDIRTKAQEYAALFNEKDNVESFLFFTDPHLIQWTGWEDNFMEKLNVLEDFYNSTPTKFCLCGGDWLGNTDLPEEACFKLGYLQATMKKKCTPYYAVVGNHDTNYQGKLTPESENWTGRISNETVRNLWYGSGSKSYYDFKGDKTRFFVLDTQTENESMTANNGYQWAQIAWLGQELLSNTDEHLILVGHIYKYNDAGNIQPITRNALNLIKAFNDRDSITLNGITYDFSSATGTVHCMIAGHTHVDELLTDTTGLPIWITKNSNAGTTGDFDLMFIDYDSNTMQSVAIGNSRENRSIELYTNN